MASDVEITLGLDDTEYQKGIEGVEKNTRQAAKNSGDRLERDIGDRGSRAFRRLAVAATAAAGAIAAGLFTRASIRAASEQESVTRRLETALLASGQEVEENSRKIQEFANELQKTTTLSNEAVEAQAAYALSLGATADQVTPLVRASADLSSALGVSFQGATQRLSRTLQGDLSPRLAQLIPELRDLTEEQLRSGAAIDFVAQRFAGVAASEAQTFGGSITQVSESFADLQKAFGRFITQSDFVRTSIQLVNRGIQSTSQFLERIQPRVTAFGESLARGFLVAGRQVEIFVRDTARIFEPWFNAITARITQIIRLLNGFGAPFQGIINAFRVVRNAIVGGFAEITLAIFSTLDAIERLDKLNLTGLAGLREQIDEGLLAGIRNTEDAAENTRESIKKLFDPAEYETDTVSAKFKNFFNEIDESARDSDGDLIFDKLLGAFSKERTEETLGNITALQDGVTTTLEKTGDEIVNFATDAQIQAQALQRAFGIATGAITKSIQFLGANLVEGGSFFKGFAAIALDAIGDLLIAFGTGAVLTGTVAEALRTSITSLFGGQAIVAGIAAIAAGGALKAFSGRIGGASGGSPSIQTGIDSGASIPATETAQVEQTAQREARQNVQLVVQGDILDSEDTGRRLLDIFNDNFENDDSALVGARLA